MAATKKEEPKDIMTEEQYDPWKDMREIYLPRAPRGDEPTMFAGVNGRTYLLPYGKKSVVPLPVYEVIMRKLEADAALDRLMAEIPNKTPGRD